MSIDDRETQHVDDEPPRDDELRALYRQLPVEEPRAEIDDAIQAAARRAVGTPPMRVATQELPPASPRALPRALRWAVPFATAASLVLVVMLARDEHPERAAVPEALQEMASVGHGRDDSASAPAMAAPEVEADVIAEVKALAKPDAAMPATADAMDDASTAAESMSAPQSPAKPSVASPAAPSSMSPEVAAAPVVEVARVAEAVASAPAADFDAEESTAAALVKDEVSRAQLARRKSVARAMPLESAAGTGAASVVARGAATAAAPQPAPEMQAATAIDWPWTTVPGTRIGQGWLAGYHLLRRTGGPGDAAAAFVVRGDAAGDEGGDAAGWRDAIAGSLVHVQGWAQAEPCTGDAGIRLLKGAAQVTVKAEAGEVVLTWQREAGCGR